MHRPIDGDRRNHHAERMPTAPDMVMETSEGRFQAVVMFDQPQEPGAVKERAKGLKQAAQCDHGTSDLSHVWRVAGTQNWPNKKKVAEGRSPIPQQVKLREPWAGTVTRPTDIPLPVVETPAPTSVANSGPVDLSDLSPGLQELVRDGVPEGQRSEEFHHAVGWLKDEGYSADAIVKVMEAHPGGIAEKYINRDLAKEVKRCFDKVETKADTKHPALKPKDGLRLFSLDEIINWPLPTYLVDGMLPEKGGHARLMAA